MRIAIAFLMAAVGIVLGLRSCVMVRTPASEPPETAGPTAVAGSGPARLTTSRQGVVTGLVAIGLLIGAIILLARSVLSHEPLTSLDEATTLELRRNARPWLTSSMRAVTWFGSLVVVLPLSAACCGLLVWRHRRSDAVLLGAATLGAAGLNPLIKLLVARSRPDEVASLAGQPSTYSFPSGHAAVSSAFYLTVALLATERRGWSVDRRTGLLWAAAVVPGVIGLSRIYLGVHYLSDVVGGAAVGVCWMTTCVLLARVLPERWFRDESD